MKNMKTDRICQSNDQRYKVACASYTGKETRNPGGMFLNLNAKSSLKGRIEFEKVHVPQMNI
jgi:hypothetical protein